MIAAPIPDNEADRLASLRKMHILSTLPEEAFDRITRLTRHIFKVSTVTITIVDEHRQWFKSKIGMPVQETPRDISFCSHVVYHDETLVIEDASKDERFSDSPLVCSDTNIRFYAGRPLRNAEGFVIGSLCLIDKKPRQISQEELSVLDDLGHMVEMVFVVRRLSSVTATLMADLDTAKRESMIDSMLGIWNYGAIMDILARENDHAERYGNPLSLLMVDIDYFKKINDTYGHPVGDTVLKEVVNAVRQQLRSYDSLGRYGGEEFMIVLPNTGKGDALKLAERLRHSVEKSLIRVEDHDLHCTISIGVGVVPIGENKPDIGAFVVKADQALLRAKANGRNRIEIAIQHD